MNRKLQAILVSACLYVATGAAQVGGNFLPRFKEELVETLRTADQQCEWMQALLEHKGVKWEDLSVAEVTKTIKDLEFYIERLSAHKQLVGQLTEEERSCEKLAVQLVHHLTVALVSCKEKTETDESVKKIAISVGAGVAVFGGLMLLNALTSLNISLSTALLCGLATGCVVGIATHFDSLVSSVRSVSCMMHGSLPQGSAWRDGFKAVAAVGAVAVVSGIIYTKRDLFFDGKKQSQKSLETMIQDVGLSSGLIPIA